MPRILKVADHLSREELERRYRSASDGVERSHWQMLWLVSGGMRTPEVGRVTGYSDRWVRELVHRYNQEGPEAMRDGRHDNPGPTHALTPELARELEAVMAQRSPDGGVWTSPKVAAWLSQRMKEEVSEKKAWRWLHEQGYVLRRPRPRHVKASKEAQSGGVQG